MAEQILFASVRVYPNDERRYNAVAIEDLIGHILYNMRFRFGNDLFIDGKLVYKSVVWLDLPERRERLARLEKEIQEENWVPKKCNRPYS